jgi:CxxC-x17-CxxC domain-containing protein
MAEFRGKFGKGTRRSERTSGFSRGPRTGSSGFGRRREESGERREGFRRTGKSRADYEMHKVKCSSCGNDCEVPFKPTNTKPVYCSDCFKGKTGPAKQASPDLEQINKKLDKIMKALKIE